LQGILWVHRSGARWKNLPDCFSSPRTCWRRLNEWDEAGIRVEIWDAFLDALDEQGLLTWEEIFVDGSFSPARRGATMWEKPNRKGYKVDGGG
jgi:transposase